MKEEVRKAVREELRCRKKLIVLEYADLCGSVTKACKEFDVPKSPFYEWKETYVLNGRAGLVRKKPIPKSHPRSVPEEVIEKILHIRSTYQLGPERIMWYLERYHGIKISESSVYRILVRHGMNRLPKSAPHRAIHTKRYFKTVPGHHIQVDVKFLWLKDAEGQRIRRFQYTAIDDATRIRA